MKLIYSRKRFEARRAGAAKRRALIGENVLSDKLGSATSIGPRNSRATEGNELDRMSEKIAADADTLHRKSILLLRETKRALKRMKAVLKNN